MSDDGVDDFGRAVANVAVAQICEGVGFDGVKQSALETLSDIAIRYICDLGKSASFYASLAGRKDSNLFDIVKALEDLGSSTGVLKDIAEYLTNLEETQFAVSIPRFPVTKSPRIIPSFSQMNETPIGSHIPTWLPAFPDTHTYIHSPIWNERKTDPRTDKVEQVRQRRKAERSLLSLQKRLLSSGLGGPSSSGYCDVVNGVLGGANVETNPFLAPPLEKDVSNVVLPSKLAVGDDEAENKQVSVLETFSPALDAMKGGGESDSMDLDQRVVSERRPVVHFKLKVGKKLLVEDLDVNLRSFANERRSSSVGRDDDNKDDKKRRAEMILRQSMTRVAIAAEGGELSPR